MAYSEPTIAELTSTAHPSGANWPKDTDGFYRCRGTATPSNSTVTACVFQGEAITMGLAETPPAGSHYQFRFTLPPNTQVALVVTSSSGGVVDVEPTINTKTGA